MTPGQGEWQLILLANGKALSCETLKLAAGLTPRFCLVQSEEVLSPGRARNLAMEKAEGEWIFFLDDDAYVLPGYWETVAPLLLDQKIDVLGGPDSPASGMGPLSLSLALALSSPFCSGTTYFRHRATGTRPILADEEKLTSCNLWVRRSSLDDVRFPEDYIRGEETVFLQRLKRNNRFLFHHPKLVVGHYRRTSLSQLLRPGFYAGFYRSRLMKQKLRKGNEIFWLPAFFVLLHGLIFLEPVSFWYLVRLYAGVILLVSMGLATRAKRPELFALVAFLHYFIVLLYGVGFLAERISRSRS